MSDPEADPAGPRVAIAFPAYNGARFLRGAVEGALAQTYPHIDILVVDDCSKDDTVEVARSLGPRVAVHRNEKNLGIGGNWNRCIELTASADLLLIAHQDDRMHPRLVERSVAALVANPAVGFVHSDMEQIDDEGRARAGHWTSDGASADWVRSGQEYYERMFGVMPICCPTVVARRSLYDRVGLYDTSYSYALDMEMYFRFLLAGDVAYLAERLYQWRRHDAQTTSAHNKAARYADILRAKRAGLALAEKSGRFDAAALRRFRRMIARDCAEAARRYALGAPGFAREKLGDAWRLSKRAALSEDFIVGSFRTLWARVFGATAAGRERARRKDF